jgi:hypothetical protein
MLGMDWDLNDLSPTCAALRISATRLPFLGTLAMPSFDFAVGIRSIVHCKRSMIKRLTDMVLCRLILPFCLRLLIDAHSNLFEINELRTHRGSYPIDFSSSIVPKLHLLRQNLDATVHFWGYP